MSKKECQQLLKKSAADIKRLSLLMQANARKPGGVASKINISNRKNYEECLEVFLNGVTDACNLGLDLVKAAAYEMSTTTKWENILLSKLHMAKHTVSKALEELAYLRDIKEPILDDDKLETAKTQEQRKKCMTPLYLRGRRDTLLAVDMLISATTLLVACELEEIK